MWSRSFLLLFIVLFSTNIYSQKKNIDLKKGNRDFNEGKYADAEANYRIEKSKTDDKSTAIYNLGNAIYKQKSYEESKAAYLQAVEHSTNKTEKHKAYHNLGNVMMQEKNYQAAVEAYKNALRNNPYDEKTRYNYALAKDMLEKNPPPPDQNQDNKDNKDKDNKDQEQDQNQNKENQKGGDNQDQDNQDNQDKGQDQRDNKDQKPDGNQDQKPEGKESGIPKQHIENLLDAVENQEKGIQKRVQNQKELEQKKMQPRQTDKNW